MTTRSLLPSHWLFTIHRYLIPCCFILLLTLSEAVLALSQTPTSGLAVGGQVWQDENGNGFFESSEQGIDGVLVLLYTDSNGTNVFDVGDDLVASTTTSEGGLYVFGGLDPGDYIVVIASSNFSMGGPLEGLQSTGVLHSVPDPDTDVDNDNNGQPVPSAPGIVATGAVTLSDGDEPTGDGDENPNTNRTVDLGFTSGPPSPPQPPLAGLTLGDLVWLDENANGIIDSDAGIDGVVVELYEDTNGNNTFDRFTMTRDRFVASTTTSGGGLYRFGGLQPGNYIVVIPSRNFLPGGALHNLRSTGELNSPVPDPDDDINNDNNGQPVAFDFFSAVASQAVTLAFGSEPTSEDEDADTNLTVDFGFIFDPTPEVRSVSLTIGDRVWLDEDANGLFDASEGGIDGVFVRLYEDSNFNNKLDSSDALLASTTTSGGGLYSFGGLLPGDYIVHLPPSNFGQGGVLETLRSTGDLNSPVPDPNDDVDNDNNGQHLAFSGVSSQAVTLTPLGEPTSEDDDPNTNLTVDFGFVSDPAFLALPPEGLTLGDRVWQDANGNGLFESSEQGIDGVLVLLYRDGNGTNVFDLGDEVVASTTTSGGGLYRFAGLQPGNYIVLLDFTNFLPTGPLRNFEPSSLGTAPDPDDDVDDDNNAEFISHSSSIIASKAVSVDYFTEPLIEDGNRNTNLTVDFGLIFAPPPPEKTTHDTGCVVTVEFESVEYLAGSLPGDIGSDWLFEYRVTINRMPTKFALDSVSLLPGDKEELGRFIRISTDSSESFDVQIGVLATERDADGQRNNDRKLEVTTFSDISCGDDVPGTIVDVVVPALGDATDSKNADDQAARATLRFTVNVLTERRQEK